MRALILILIAVSLIGCDESTKNNVAQTLDNQENLTSEEIVAQEEIQNEANETEAELEKFAAASAEVGLIDAESPTLVPDPYPFYYEWFKRLAHRLNKLENGLERVYKAYKNLPERLQKIIKPWLTIHLRHVHSRLDSLKNRIMNYYRKSFQFDVCIMVDSAPHNTADVKSIAPDSSGNLIASTDEVKIDEDGTRYTDVDAQVVRPYICVPDATGKCIDYCADNTHLVKRIINRIEEVQALIKRIASNL